MHGAPRRSSSGWGNRHRKRKAQDGWQETLLLDNEIGWGVYGYKRYTPVELNVGKNTPAAGKVGAARAKVIELPADPEEAKQVVLDATRAAVKRLNMKPQQFFNTINKKKQKVVAKEDLRAALHSLTKYQMTDLVLDPILALLNPEGADGGGLSLKTLKETFTNLVPDKKALARAEAAVAKAAKDAAKKAADAPPEEPPDVLLGTKPPRPPAKGDFVEVNVGGTDGDPDQWLQAEVASDKVSGGGYTVRMMHGYEPEDATFDVDCEYMRAIPKRAGNGPRVALEKVCDKV